MRFEVKENVFRYYLYWMKQRQDIWWRRYRGKPLRVEDGKEIWTNDELLQNHKFTNVYRCLDRVSQYLIKNIVNNDEKYSNRDLAFRIYFFKIFNKINTWEMVNEEFGDFTIDVFEDKGHDIAEFLLDKMKSKMTIFSNAYIMNSHYLLTESCKHKKYFDVFNRFFLWEDTITKEKGILDKVLESMSLEEVFNHFMTLPMHADFVSYQYATDFNYSKVINFHENDFVRAGVGAKRFIDKAFTFDKKEASYEGIIEWIADNIVKLREEYSNRFDEDYISFKPLPGREPTLIDYQNCCCESDKYTRGLGIIGAKEMYTNKNGKAVNRRIKNKFVKTKEKIDFDFPKKWGEIL